MEAQPSQSVLDLGRRTDGGINGEATTCEPLLCGVAACECTTCEWAVGGVMSGPAVEVGVLCPDRVDCPADEHSPESFMIAESA